MKTFSFLKRHPIFASISIVLLLLAVAFSLKIKSSKAILPFGGQILDVTYCICSGDLQITVGTPAGGVFMYQPGASTLYSFYQIFRPGPWVLGSYSPGGACVQLIPADPPFCWAYPTQGTITDVGTSM